MPEAGDKDMWTVLYPVSYGLAKNAPSDNFTPTTLSYKL